jgi:hypothetical protein
MEKGQKVKIFSNFKRLPDHVEGSGLGFFYKKELLITPEEP